MQYYVARQHRIKEHHPTRRRPGTTATTSGNPAGQPHHPPFTRERSAAPRADSTCLSACVQYTEERQRGRAGHGRREVGRGSREDRVAGGGRGRGDRADDSIYLAAQLEVDEDDGDLRAGDDEDDEDQREEAEDVVELVEPDLTGAQKSEVNAAIWRAGSASHHNPR